MYFDCRASLLGHLVDKIQSSPDPDVVIAGVRVLIAQKEAIEKDIAQSTPLVGERYIKNQITPLLLEIRIH